jgi:hypothetical protein
MLCLVQIDQKHKRSEQQQQHDQAYPNDEQRSLTYQDTIDLRTASGTGIGQLIAANGDTIYLTNTGSADLASKPGFAIITEIYTTTGGTGRFAGAQGSFALDRSVNNATGFTSGSFHGTITSPGAAH